MRLILRENASIEPYIEQLLSLVHQILITMGGACISIHALGPQDQLLVTTLTGKNVVDGPGIAVCGLLKTAQKRRCEVLEPSHYVFIKTTTTGELSRVIGPALLRLGPYDEIIARERAITLERNEYVRFVDTVTGAVRVECGEAIVYMEPTEKPFENSGIIQGGLLVNNPNFFLTTFLKPNSLTQPSASYCLMVTFSCCLSFLQDTSLVIYPPTAAAFGNVLYVLIKW